ncbi:MAG: AAA family ATPase [Gemmatimonadota bacterium]|jgi:class 3 adenylate cyclase/tetratricopeptide (TPR) repeat protein
MNDASSLLPFVPRLAVGRLVPGEERPLAPRAESLSGATLFVDISGYSSLVERLSEEGSRGAERTQEILNRVFGPLASLIEEAGGEILRFPGDAALAFFAESDSAGTADAVRRAGVAALRAVDLLDGSSVEEDVALRIRVAIGAGSVWAGIVGGIDGRFELLVRGAAIEQLSGALAAARPGEVVMSAEASTLAANATRGEARGSAYVLVSVEAPPPSHVLDGPLPHRHVEAFVPRSVRARLAAGQREFLAELRPVSAVFVAVHGLDHRASDALERLQTAFTAAQSAVQHFGGSVNQVVEDDKGVVFLIGFGVALHAHEDDALRATLAAMRIREELVQQGLDPRIGVASGLTFTGWRGGEDRIEYALIGSTINLAARLMQQADPILCDANTRLAARRQVLFESLPPLWVKGSGSPLKVYRPRSVLVEKSASGLLGGEAALIGRDFECQTLETRLAGLDRASEGGVVVLEGEPGLGKSSLVRHLVAAAQPTSVRTLVGLGEATEQKTAMFAWKPVVSALLGAFVAPDEAAVTERLTALIGAEWVESLPVLNPVLPIRLRPTPVSQHISPQARSEMIRDLIRRLFFAVTARTPVVLVLDDAHWMDSASWELAEAVADVPGVLLVVSMRPMAERPPSCERMLDHPRSTVVRLDLVSAADTVVLACQQLDVDTLPEEVARFIQRRAEGHPLFVEQLTHALRESGLLEIAAHECRLVGTAGELEGLEVPETLSGLIRSRIDALRPEEQLTLKVASVLGRHFGLEGLSAVHPLHADHQALVRQIQAMVALGLLTPPASEPEAWEFRHALIQEAAYALLPYAQRREFHLATAGWLERQFEDDLQSVHPALGHHYEQAGDNRAAIRHLTAAGDHALELWENTEVVHFFERVIRLDEELGASRELDQVVLAGRERKLGEALCNLGHLDRGIPLLQGALRRLGLRVPKRHSALVMGLLGRVLRVLARAPRVPTSRVESEGEARLVRETISAVLPLGSAAYSRGTIVESTYLTLRAMDVARRLGPSAELAEVYVGISNIAAMGHRLEIARAYAAQGAEMAEREGNLAVLGASLCAGQLFEVAVANFDAVDSIERGAAILARVGEIYRWYTGALVVSHFHLMKGDFESSQKHASEVLVKAREGKAVLQQLWALAAMADSHMRSGRLDDAITTAQEALEMLRVTETADHIAPFRASGVLASAWLRRHGAPPPTEILERGEQAMREGGWHTYSPGTDFVGLAEARICLISKGEGDRAEHLQSLRDLARALKRTVFLRPVARSSLLWLRAEIDWHTGRERRAERMLRKAIESAEAYRLPFERARWQMELARKLGPQSTERVELLSTAEDTFATIGASWELEEARGLAR